MLTGWQYPCGLIGIFPLVDRTLRSACQPTVGGRDFLGGLSRLFSFADGG